MKVLIITPFKNEAASIEKTIQSIVKQSVHPVKWLMIDDVSDDRSPRLVQEYQARFPFIYYHKRKKIATLRTTGNNIVEIFNEGLKLADGMGIDWDIVVKLDADLIVQRTDYLEFMSQKFEQYPLLGIASGVTFVLKGDNNKMIESRHKWHTQGPNKFYRKECLEAIGGLRPFKGWDGIDDILARAKGYITEKFFEQELQHLYPTQTRAAEGGFKKGLLREAKGYTNMGYPLYVSVLRSMKIAKERGLHSGLLFFNYVLKHTITDKPMVTKEEKKLVARFMRQRWNNNFLYTKDLIR
ncbi:MAG: glycosyltransferase family A protein [Bacteroidota bacterium]